MANITLIQGSDIIKNSRLVIDTNFTNLNTAKAEISGQVFTGAITAPNLMGTNTGDVTLTQLLPAQASNAGKILQTDGTNVSWASIASASSGTVTSVSVVSANGFTGTVATPTSTPAITLTTSVTGLLKGNGTAVSAATAGADYSVPSGTENLLNKTLLKPRIDTVDKVAVVYGPAAGATAVVDGGTANMHFIIMPAGNITIAVSNFTNNQPFMVRILQDSVGSRTVAWFATIRWAAGIIPTLTTTANKADTFGFYRTGVNTYDGFVIGANI